MALVGMRSWEVAYKNILSAEYIREKNATRIQQFKQNITDANDNSYVIQKHGKTIGIMKIAESIDEDLDSNLDGCLSITTLLVPPATTMEIFAKITELMVGY